MEDYFLGKSLDIDEQITGVLEVFIFVVGVVGISGLYRNSEFYGGEVILLDEVSVYARHICTAIDQCSSINDFHQT